MNLFFIAFFLVTQKTLLTHPTLTFSIMLKISQSISVEKSSICCVVLADAQASCLVNQLH